MRGQVVTEASLFANCGLVILLGLGGFMPFGRASIAEKSEIRHLGIGGPFQADSMG